jgi:secreted PhoX family phosphatase
MSLTRRIFLRNSIATSAAFAGLASMAAGQSGEPAGYLNQVPGFGPLQPDPASLFELPRGFTYQVLSTVGDEMTDGLLAPGDFDGMGCFARDDGRIVLVRNHELNPAQTEVSAFGPANERLGLIDRALVHDWTADGLPNLGGTSHLVLNAQTLEVEEEYLSLVGTINNCAGGVTPWGSWITCEETTVGIGDAGHVEHGYCFEVPASATGLVAPVPLKAMGRFRHEAVAVDPDTGIVYETEDEYAGACFYRFVPNVPGQLAEGGRLQALAVRGRPGLDIRNWADSGPEVAVGDWLEVEWIDLDDVESPNADLWIRAVAAGAAKFTRCEGLFWGDGECYFTSTDGGPAHIGQIWRYQPSPLEGQTGETGQPARLQLFVESDDPQIMEKCDNICVAPWGDLIVVEDGDAEQYIRGVTPAGQVYTIGRNAASGPDGNKSEITGPCFSPDGSTLFFNVQRYPGRTFAVRGPWGDRSL